MKKKPQTNGAPAKPNQGGQGGAKAQSADRPAAPKVERARLAVSLDGKSLPEPEAREIWVAFSAYMDEHEDDAAGFAKSRGWVSAAPTYLNGQAVLVVKTR